MKRLSFRPIPYDSVVAAQVNQLHRIHSISLRFFNISFSVLTIRFSPGCQVERRFDATLDILWSNIYDFGRKCV